MLYPPGIEFIAAFMGALYAGVIAIPVPPPDQARLKRTLPRLKSIIADAKATVVLATESIENSLTVDNNNPETQFPAMQWFA